jgi:hypothetical protein
LSRQASKKAKPWLRRRDWPRSSQTVELETFSRKRAALDQLAFQPFDGRQVEMVGRLVEQQDIRLWRHDAGQGCAAGLTA